MRCFDSRMSTLPISCSARAARRRLAAAPAPGDTEADQDAFLDTYQQVLQYSRAVTGASVTRGDR